MPVSEETLLIVVLVAIAANLLLGIGLLVVPRFRRRSARAEVEAASRPRSGGSGERPPTAMFGAIGSAAVPADPQTGLEIASTWNRWLREEEARIKRYRRPATVVLVEIEGLDRLVERLGPGSADRLIPPVAATMRRHAREADRVARLGPARFGALLPETDEVQAINYVERVRAACDLWLAAGAVTLRLSVGWAEGNAGRTLTLAVDAAEERLNAERRRDQALAPTAVGGAIETAVGHPAPAG